MNKNEESSSIHRKGGPAPRFLDGRDFGLISREF